MKPSIPDSLESATRRRGGRTLFAIILLSTVLRLVVAGYQGDEIDTLPGIYDQVSYHTLADRVLDGHGFSFATNWWPATKANQPTAHWSFLYTLYLVAIYGVFGVHPLVARLVQALIVGILQPWLTWRIAGRIFSRRVALLAAGVSAVYAYFIYYAGALMSEAFYIVALLLVFDLVMRLGERPDAANRGREAWSLWLSLGLVLGIAALLRQVFLLVIPLLFAWIIVRRLMGRQDEGPADPGWAMKTLSKRFPLRGLLVASLVLLATIVPWTVRNYLAFHQFVLLNTNAGFVLFWGNHPIHKDHFIPILPAGGPSYVDLLPISLKKLDEASLDRALMKRGIGFVTADPTRFALLSLSRAEEYFRFWPSRDSSLASNLARLLSFGILLPFMLIGIASCATARRDRTDRGGDGRTANAVLLLLFAASYTLIHLLTWTLIRYRVPVDGILVIFAASGLWAVAGVALDAVRRFTRPETAQQAWSAASIKRSDR
ncbi:MAG: glycosyltransferase family 39 protein [Acidobacteriota bacterium]